jgi:hypothetical protein
LYLAPIRVNAISPSGNNVTVRFGRSQSGWSDGRTSAVYPCLRFAKGRVAVDANGRCESGHSSLRAAA